jgi:hypothetical protein
VLTGREVFLDGKGFKLADDAPPVKLGFNLYDQKDFARLNLPLK